jgi:hypothetical protein
MVFIYSNIKAFYPKKMGHPHPYSAERIPAEIMATEDMLCLSKK